MIYMTYMIYMTSKLYALFKNENAFLADLPGKPVHLDQNIMNGLLFAFHQICPVVMTSTNYGVVVF